MNPQSASLEWRHYEAKDAKRKEWKYICPNCNRISWLRTGPKKILKQKYCKSCAHEMPISDATKEKISQTLRGKYKTDPEFVERVLKAQNRKSGPDHWNWKGGVTPINQRDRVSEDYSSWRLAVFSRDRFCCRVCKSKENLQAHHINSWAEFPEDRFVLQNGLTLCKDCHDQYHKYEKEVKNNYNFGEG
jgi:5-methylcytosine-specific restriction endonuclease McrA